MARLLEDSDSDLPDLTELLKNSKGRSRPAKEAQPRQHLKQREKYSENHVGSLAETRLSESEMTVRDDPEVRSEVEKTEGGRARKPRKRVLSQRQDNPLLRPMSQLSNCCAVSEPPILNQKTIVGLGLPSLGGDGLGSMEQVEAPGTSMPTSFRNSARQDEAATKSHQRRDILSAKSKSKSSTASRPALRTTYGDDGTSDSDGLSDFIVNDSSDLESEDSLAVPPPAPRSTRRLVRGRRPQKLEEEENSKTLGLRMDQLTIKDGANKGRSSRNRQRRGEFDLNDSDSEASLRKTKPRQRSETPAERTFEASTSKLQESISPALCSDTEDKATLHYSPPGNRVRKVCPVTPPHSPEPKPKSLKSPAKKPQRIPATPHRPSMDSFWDQEVVTQWNEEYSPQKTIKASRPLIDGTSRVGNLLFPAQKSPKKQAQAIKAEQKKFSEIKQSLAISFLSELDDVITNGQVSKLAAAAGGVQIIWSKKLNSTAGRANWKRELVQAPLMADGKTLPPTYRQIAFIELAEKVIDDEHKLLNVIAHEFCHLANFMVSNIRTNPHGKEFKAWASKCSKHFGDRGIEVTTKHSYEIHYKYIWECENCGLNFKRHSKSIEPERHRCGSCKSKLVQVKPVPRRNGEKKIGAYQVFLKANMDRVRKENPGSPQKDIMGLIAKSYQEHKALISGNEVKEIASVGVSELHLSRDSTPDEDVDLGSVVKKLEILDLLSP